MQNKFAHLRGTIFPSFPSVGLNVGPDPEAPKSATARAMLEVYDRATGRSVSAVSNDSRGAAKAEARGVQMERTRWMAVFAGSAAAGRHDEAVTLLGSTDLTAKQILAALETLPISATKSRRGGASQPVNNSKATAEAMMAVYNRAVGGK